VRREILKTVSDSLDDEYQLLIKPHPIETDSALKEIRKLLPKAVIIKPKYPIEPLIAQSDVIVNRGNSQVMLLAMMQNKRIIAVPAGLNSIFETNRETASHTIGDRPENFKKILNALQDEKNENHDKPCNRDRQKYNELLKTHFPLDQQEALEQVGNLFRQAFETGGRKSKSGIFYISMLYAFLGDSSSARKVLETAQEQFPELSGHQVPPLLGKLYEKQIGVEEFQKLLDFFPHPIQRWHLQALFIRRLFKTKDQQMLKDGTALLNGFDGDVNPHYFINEILQRIELEFHSGNIQMGEKLIEKFHRDYAVFDYYRQAFDMIRFVYQSGSKQHILRKTIWLTLNFSAGYTRKFIKDKLRKK
jgi:hypothetical protein